MERVPPDRLVLLPNGVQALPPGHRQALRGTSASAGASPVVRSVSSSARRRLDVLVGAAALLGKNSPVSDG